MINWLYAMSTKSILYFISTLNYALHMLHGSNIYNKTTISPESWSQRTVSLAPEKRPCCSPTSRQDARTDRAASDLASAPQKSTWYTSDWYPVEQLSEQISEQMNEQMKEQMDERMKAPPSLAHLAFHRLSSFRENQGLLNPDLVLRTF